MSSRQLQTDVRRAQFIQGLKEREAMGDALQNLTPVVIPPTPTGVTPVALATPVVVKHRPANSPFVSRDLVATLAGNQIVGANNQRQYLNIQNKDLNNPIYLQFGAFQGNGNGAIPPGDRIVAGGSYEMSPHTCSSGVWAVAQGAAVIVVITEG